MYLLNDSPFQLFIPIQSKSLQNSLQIYSIINTNQHRTKIFLLNPDSILLKTEFFQPTTETIQINMEAKQSTTNPFLRTKFSFYITKDSIYITREPIHITSKHGQISLNRYFNNSYTYSSNNKHLYQG